MRKGSGKVWCALAGLLLLGSAVSAGAYETYNSGCSSCHGDFENNPYVSPSGTTFPTDLHTLHRDQGYMNTTCELCHMGDNGDPWTGWSEGTNFNAGFGCAGCHGRMGTQWPRVDGLIAVHMANGGTCTSCHYNVQVPDPEDELPPYYGTPDTNVAAPCNDDLATSEDWSGEGDGLDNDGDGDLDMWDWDCNPCYDGDGDGYGHPAAITCNGGLLEDCDDNNPNVNPGHPEVACDGLDNDCDPATPDADDHDGDGFNECEDCDDMDSDIHPGQPETTCDGVDNDCDPATVDAPDHDGDGYDVCEDCNDEDASVNPDAVEDCFDGIDNDCDGGVDGNDDECGGDDDSGDDDAGDDDGGDDDGGDDDGGDDDGGDDDAGDDDGGDDDAGDDDDGDEDDDEFVAPSDCECQADLTAGSGAAGGLAAVALMGLLGSLRRWRRRPTHDGRTPSR